jgi:thiol:disulfide interchange protein DsbC
MNLPKLIGAALLALPLAATAAPGAKAKQSIAPAAAEKIRAGASRLLDGLEIEKLSPTDHANLVEILTPSGIFYTDMQGSFVIFGAAVVDAGSKENLTAKAWDGYGTFRFEDLPFKDAVKTVRGNGSRVMVTLEDPNCGFCRKLMTELQKVDNVTIYTFLVPILSKDSHEKVKGIWCAPDRAQAWQGLMTGGAAPAAATCETPTERNLVLYRKLRASGTPAMLFPGNKRISGYATADRIEAKLANPLAGTK